MGTVDAPEMRSPEGGVLDHGPKYGLGVDARMTVEVAVFDGQGGGHDPLRKGVVDHWPEA